MAELTSFQIGIMVLVVAAAFGLVGFLVFRMQRTRDELQKEDAAELSELAEEEKKIEGK